jgi:hypothetical protein
VIRGGDVDQPERDLGVEPPEIVGCSLLIIEDGVLLGISRPVFPGSCPVQFGEGRLARPDAVQEVFLARPEIVFAGLHFPGTQRAGSIRPEVLCERRQDEVAAVSVNTLTLDSARSSRPRVGLCSLSIDRCVDLPQSAGFDLASNHRQVCRGDVGTFRVTACELFAGIGPQRRAVLG